MKIIDVMTLRGTDREVNCPKGGFNSLRMLLRSDDMGYTVTRTTVHPTKDFQKWHYKNHLEACYCIKGNGVVKDAKGNQHKIKPGIMYALNKHDKHWFKALTTVVLVCVFNPPLNGREVHQKDGSYSLKRTKR